MRGDPHAPAATAQRPSVGVVIVNFNCSAETELCVRSLAAVRYPGLFAVIVDSGSTRESPAKLHRLTRELPAVVVLNPSNDGFAASCNIGIRHARIHGAEYIWLLNPDTVVDRRALSALLAATAASPSPVVCGSKVLYGPELHEDALRLVDNPAFASKYRRIWGVGGEIDLGRRAVSMRGTGEEDSGQLDALARCDYVPGCSLFASAETFRLVGDLDERFFLYFEETEWCLRAAAQGIGLVVAPDSVVWHRFDDAKLRAPLTTYYYNRSRLRFWYGCSRPIARLRIIVRTALRDLPGAVRALVSTRDAALKATFRAHCYAYLDFLLGRARPRALR